VRAEAGFGGQLFLGEPGGDAEGLRRSPKVALRTLAMLLPSYHVARDARRLTAVPSAAYHARTLQAKPIAI
jgi:hypothetical protein